MFVIPHGDYYSILRRVGKTLVVVILKVNNRKIYVFLYPSMFVYFNVLYVQ